MKGKTSPVVACDTSLRGTINAGFSSTSKQREEPEKFHKILCYSNTNKPDQCWSHNQMQKNYAMFVKTGSTNNNKQTQTTDD